MPGTNHATPPHAHPNVSDGCFHTFTTTPTTNLWSGVVISVNIGAGIGPGRPLAWLRILEPHQQMCAGADSIGANISANIDASIGPPTAWLRILSRANKRVRMRGATIVANIGATIELPHLRGCGFGAAPSLWSGVVNMGPLLVSTLVPALAHPLAWLQCASARGPHQTCGTAWANCNDNMPTLVPYALSLGSRNISFVGQYLLLV